MQRPNPFDSNCRSRFIAAASTIFRKPTRPDRSKQPVNQRAEVQRRPGKSAGRATPWHCGFRAAPIRAVLVLCAAVFLMALCAQPLSAQVTMTCNPSIGPAQVGVAYSTTCTISGGTPPYSFGLNPPNTIPAGLNIFQSSPTTGLITGTPTATGTYSFGIFGQDSANHSTTISFNGSIVAAGAPTISCSSGAGPVAVGTPYSINCTASGGTPPYTFLFSGPEPAGLNYTQTSAGAATATVTGTPTTAGPYNWSLFVQDSTGTFSNTIQYAGTIAGVTPVSMTCNPSTGPTAVGVAYSTTCTISGGTPPYSFGLNPPNVIPAGLNAVQSSATTALISGTPTTAGPYSFGLFGQDSANHSTNVTFTGTIAGAISMSCNPSTGPTTVGVAYSTTCTVSGGTPPYSFGLNPPNVIPAGLNIFQSSPTTGLITGTPTTAGAYSFGIFGQDSANHSITVTFTGTLAAATALSITCNPSTGPSTVGTFYSTTCTAAGGTPPYAFGLNPPNVIPAGLSIVQASATTARVSGTPTQSGPYSFGVFAQDATNASITATFTGTLGSGSCTFTFTPASGATFPPTGTSTVETCPNNSGQPNCGVVPETPQSVTVTPSASCGAWTATSSSPGFLQITNGVTGNGPGAVTYVLLNNTHTLTQNLAITLSSASGSASFPVSQTGSGDSEVFRQVYALYEQLLGRDPDAGGFAFWTGSGGAGLGQMADSFLTSPEAFNSDFVVMATYQAATGAPPNYNQFITAVSALRANLQTVTGLFNSLTPGGYSTTTLYQNLLGRTPTAQEISSANAAGLASWFQTLIGFPNNTTPVFSPNNEFQSTGSFHSVLSSDHTNGLYTRMVYYVTLSRDPDPAGLAFWTGIANGGGPGLLFQGNGGFATRIQILGPGTPNQGFIGSPEFQGLFAN